MRPGFRIHGYGVVRQDFTDLMHSLVEGLREQGRELGDGEFAGDDFRLMGGMKRDGLIDHDGIQWRYAAPHIRCL